MIIKLLVNKILNNKFKAGLIVLNIFLVTGFALFFMFLYQNIEGYFVQQKLGTDADYRFDVLGKNQLTKFLSGTGFDNNGLGELSIELRADERVDEVVDFYATTLPISIVVDFFGSAIETDIFIFAASDELFNRYNVDLDKYEMPIGISQSLMDFYNLQIANGDFFPQLTPGLFKLLKFNIEFGRSTFLNRQTDKTIIKKGKIVLLDPALPMIGLTVPYSKVKSISEEIKHSKFFMYRVVGYAKDYTSLKQLKDQYGEEFKFKTSDDTINEIQEKLASVRYFFVMINVLVLFILVSFVVYVVYFLLDSNKHIFRVMRLHGAGKYRILGFILGEKIIYLFIGSLLTCVMYFLSSSILIPNINTILSEQYLISYEFKTILLTDFAIMMSIYWVLIIFITILFSWTEWNKKFID